MWLFYVLISSVLFACSSIASRYLLKGAKDSWAYSFWFSGISALLSLPFMLYSPHFSRELKLWGLVVLASALIVVHNFFSFRAFSYVSSSIAGAITKFRLIWILVFGILFLNETLSVLKVIGTLVTIAAGMVLVRQFRAKDGLKGITFAFSATIVYGTVITLYSVLFDGFSVPTLTFLTFAIPAVLNYVLMSHSFIRAKKQIKQKPFLTLISIAFATFGNLTMNMALSRGEQSKVVLIAESSLALVLLMEIVLLNEREKLRSKIIAIILVLTGVLLVHLG